MAEGKTARVRERKGSSRAGRLKPRMNECIGNGERGRSRDLCLGVICILRQSRVGGGGPTFRLCVLQLYRTVNLR